MKLIDIQALMEIGFVSDPAISPDGRRAAYVTARQNAKENRYDTWIHVSDLETGETRQLTWSGKESGFAWEDEHTLLFPAERGEADKPGKGEEKTVFYRPWAKRMMTMLGDEKAINGHPLYGQLRRYRLQEDFLFSETELDKICGQLFVHNPKNQMAMQYLMLMPLLDKDIPRFMSYIQVIQEKTQYHPRSCQEALAFAFMQQRQQPPQGLISDMILQRMNDFSRIYSNDKNSPELARFKNTVWYYLTNGK